MKRLNKGVALIVYLIWMVLVCLIASLSVLNWLPFKSMHNEKIFTYVCETELFLFLIVWPFLLPLISSSAVKTNETKTFSEKFLPFLAHIAFIMILFVPIEFFALEVSSGNLLNYLMAKFVLFVVLLSIALFYLIFELQLKRFENFLNVYFITIFLMSAAVPLVYYIFYSLLSLDLKILLLINPFWAMYKISSASGKVNFFLSQIISFGVFILIAFFYRILFKPPKRKIEDSFNEI